MPPNSIYWITGALLGVFVILKLNVFPRISAKLPAEGPLVALLCGLALVNVFVYQRHVEGRNEEFTRKSPDDKKFDELRRTLAGKGYVGFISDTQLNASRESIMRYFHTQYALAPVVLVDGTSQDLVVGNFEKFEPKVIPGDLVLVRAFGPGLMLFRKGAQ